MFQIPFITDIHFDETSRFEETIRITDWIAEDINQRRPTLVVVGGDVFERRPTTRELNSSRKKSTACWSLPRLQTLLRLLFPPQQTSPKRGR